MNSWPRPVSRVRGKASHSTRPSTSPAGRDMEVARCLAVEQQNPKIAIDRVEAFADALENAVPEAGFAAKRGDLCGDEGFQIGRWQLG